MIQGYILVEFLQPCLSCGNREFEGDMDRFQRASDGSIIWSQSWWHAVLNRAKKSLNMDVRLSDIQFSLSVTAETAPHQRRYGGKKYRVHEAILPGNPVRFDFALDNNVSPEELEQLMRHIGKFIGISPYGYNLGYGKFEVLEVVSV